MKNVNNTQELRLLLGKTDMYLIDLIQKGYFDKPLHILDAGCGRGRNMYLLAELGHNLVGVDNNIEVVNRLKKDFEAKGTYLKDIDVRVWELDNLNFLDREFDMVICNAVLHFAKDINNFERIVSELKRVLVKKGVLFLRLVTSHTMDENKELFNREILIKDGTNRFVVDHIWLRELIETKLNLDYLEDFKTVNIDDKRTMTTLVLGAK